MSIAQGATGALSGAATGFQLGAATGMPHVAGIGAAIGGIAGFASGLFGSGGSSSGTGAGKKTKRAIRIQNELTLDSLKKDAALAIQANEKAVRLYNDMRDAKYDQDLKNWSILAEQREDNYNAAAAAFKESFDTYNDTVDLNDVSAKMAINSAKRAFNDKQTELNTQGEILALELDAGKRDYALEKDLIGKRMGFSLKDAQLNAQGINRELRNAKRDGKNAIAHSTRSFEHKTELANYNTKIRKIKDDSDNFNMKSDLATLEGEKNSIYDTAKVQQKGLIDGLDNAIAEVDFSQQELQLAQDERYAEAAIKTDELRREGLLEQGTQLAKGQAGRSAGKSMQAMAFANNQAQALIVAALTRADSKYVIDKKKMAQSLINSRKEAVNAQEEIRIGLRKSGSSFKASSLQMLAKKEDAAIRGVESDKERTNIKDEMYNTKYSNKQVFDKFRDKHKATKINISKLSNQLMSDQVENQAKLLQAGTNLFDLKTQTKISHQSLVYAGTSLSDELTATKEQIKFDRDMANRAASYNLLDEPELPDLLPPVIKAPEAIQQPLPDIDWRKIEKAMDKSRKAKMAYNPSGNSEFTAMMANVNSIALQAGELAKAFSGPPQSQTNQTTKGSSELNAAPIKFGDTNTFTDAFADSNFVNNLNIKKTPSPLVAK